MNALVVDDEPLARDWLIRLLARLNVQVCGEASDGQQALAQVRSLAPDVVLLDIHIPGLSGLQVARVLGDVPFVFTTAHARYALEAFEVEACDYLLKPIGFAQLATSLDRARRRRLLHELMRKEDAVLDSASSSFSALPDHASLDAATSEAASPGLAPPEGGTLIVRERGITRILDGRRVTRFRALDKYTSFQLDGEEFFVRDALDSLEGRLAPFGFLRVHRAELVRRTAILGLTSEPAGGVSLQLTDGQIVAVSRRYRAATRRALGIG
jgi:DNA-binding LytR/AlgR family response regulator